MQLSTARGGNGQRRPSGGFPSCPRSFDRAVTVIMVSQVVLVLSCLRRHRGQRPTLARSETRPGGSQTLTGKHGGHVTTVTGPRRLIVSPRESRPNLNPDSDTRSPMLTFFTRQDALHRDCGWQRRRQQRQGSLSSATWLASTMISHRVRPGLC